MPIDWTRCYGPHTRSTNYHHSTSTKFAANCPERHVLSCREHIPMWSIDRMQCCPRSIRLGAALQ
eukprot:3599707-Amphidinium_carterae.1